MKGVCLPIGVAVWDAFFDKHKWMSAITSLIGFDLKPETPLCISRRVKNIPCSVTKPSHKLKLK